MVRHTQTIRRQISDIFYDIDICDIASYADDNTPYTSDFNLEEVIQKVNY